MTADTRRRKHAVAARKFLRNRVVSGLLLPGLWHFDSDLADRATTCAKA